MQNNLYYTCKKVQNNLYYNISMKVGKVNGQPRQRPASYVMDDSRAGLATMHPRNEWDRAGLWCRDGRRGRGPKGETYGEGLVT
jgi:hypothetical protein